MSALADSSVINLYTQREDIWLDPPYQRYGDIWPRDKQQLLIDSILNGFDIPKLYFHEFFPAEERDGALYRFAIIDGKQRLQAIWEYLDGRYPLSDEAEYLRDASVGIAGLTYQELADQHPRLRTVLDSRILHVVTIQTAEEELIEEMFSRLNEAMPLSAAEKRNALGGPVPSKIRSVAQHQFFRTCLPFTNNRYRHFDVAAKFLYFCYRGELADTKRVYLDKFVKDAKGKGDSRGVNKAAKETERVCDRMSEVFTPTDPLLRSVGSVVLYFFLFWQEEKGTVLSLTRSSLAAFESTRRENRRVAESDIGAANYRLLEYDRLVQTPNDAFALAYRFKVLEEYLRTGKVASTV